MIPILDDCILFARLESSGIAYVIVLGVKVITFSPLIVAVLISSGVYKKSPWTTPLIFNFLNSLNATINLSTKPPEWFFLISAGV